MAVQILKLHLTELLCQSKLLRVRRSALVTTEFLIERLLQRGELVAVGVEHDGNVFIDGT